jgi:23S rRNA U2552 (ribose-2'-O)-methylase RlmE/FtsJ
MSSGAVHDPPWAHIQFVNLFSCVTWKDLQLLPPAQTAPLTPLESSEHPLRTLLLQKKNTIQEFNNEDEWELRKKYTNSYEYIFGMNDSPLPSILKQTKTFTPLSRSYFKMIEMLQVSDFFNTVKQSTFSSAHVCEGPGGFIQALLSESFKRQRKVSQALAMTLRPNKPFIPGWRRSISYLREHPEIILEYGADSTGDILSLENQRAFITKSAQKSMLFTADGGFDFSNDYSNQEIQAFELIVASFRMGLLSLAKGGFMIIKVFDVFLESTKQLLLGSGLCFTSFTVYKPATSRPCNSERYFIGRGFLGAQHAAQWVSVLTSVARRLKQHTNPTLPILFSSPFTQALNTLFTSQLEAQAVQQVQAIQNGLEFQESEKDIWVQAGLEKSRQWVATFLPSSSSAPSHLAT